MSETPRVWAIKLGSEGRCVEFCEEHGIVGVGWRGVDAEVLRRPDRNALREHLRQWYGKSPRALGSALGQLWRFAHECKVGDYVLYYVPRKRHVQITRVTSDLKRREFELTRDVDIWFYREVERRPEPIPIVDFHGALKGPLLGPQMSFWSVQDNVGAAAQLFAGEDVHVAPDAEVVRAFEALRSLVLDRVQRLDATDWEWLVADYFIAQGAHVDERRVGGSQAVIDLEARFDRGELGAESWRVQVKRYKHAIDWPVIRDVYELAGDCDRFAFVSTNGFTPDARTHAAEEGIVLLEAADFTRFLLSGKLRPRLREKLRLPFGESL